MIFGGKRIENTFKQEVAFHQNRMQWESSLC